MAEAERLITGYLSRLSCRPGGVGSGGEVFSVGSIKFLGRLRLDGFEGPVSRLMECVVRRFMGG